MLSNKGSVLDILYSGVMLFVFAICLVIATHLINQWNTEATAQGFTSEATSIISSGQTAMTAFDYGFVAITTGMIIGTVILAFMVGFHPVFFFLGILEATMVLFLIPQFSNIFYNIRQTTALATAGSSMTITSIVMDNLPIILGSACFLVIIVMYTRRGGVSA